MIESIRGFGIILNKRQKVNVWILVAMMIMAAFFEVLGVGLMLPLMTALMNENILEENEIAITIANILGISSSKEFTLLCIVIVILIYVVKDIFIIFEAYMKNRFIYNSRFYTQKKILSSYMNRSYEFFLSISSGETVQVVQRDVENTYALLLHILNFFSELIVTVALIAVVFVINPFMTGVVATVMLFSVIVISVIVRPRMFEAGSKFVGNMAIANKWLLQMISGIKEIKVAGSQNYFQKNFEKSARESIVAANKKALWDDIPRLMIEMTAICSALVALAVQLFRGEELTGLLSALSAFVMAAVRLLPAANRAVGAISSIGYYRPALEKVIRMQLDLKEDDQIEKKVKKIDTDRNLSFHKKIEFKKVYYTYPNSRQEVLHNASMDIPIGSSVGIIGVSGAGKTTVVDVLLGILRPQKGAVICDGEDILEHYDEWRSCIGYIPQMIFMMDGTIRENVVFGQGETEDVEVWRALKDASLKDFVKQLPRGLDTEIGERGIRLSGGQRQRIGIARALYKNPSILVFDEATSALDNETETMIMESINGLHGKKTIIIIAHRLTTIEECDIVYRVENGKIVQEKPNK